MRFNKILKTLLLVALTSISAMSQTISWLQLVPDNYDPRTGYVQWADEIENLTLPNTKIWQPARGNIWTAQKLIDKGATHLSKYDVTYLSSQDLNNLANAGKTYDAVPKTMEQFGVGDSGGATNWVACNGCPNTWPFIWNNLIFNTTLPADAPMTPSQGTAAGNAFSTFHNIVIWENSEQYYAVSSHWPFVRSFYDAYIPRMQSRWNALGKPFFVSHNYFSGIGGTILYMGRSDAKLWTRKTPSQWVSDYPSGSIGYPSGQMLPGGTLENTNLSCYSLYLGDPVNARNFTYNLAYSAHLNHKAGKSLVGFMQVVHEWRPNNFYKVPVSGGTFYKKDKQSPDHSTVLGLTVMSFVFGDGFMNFSFEGKKNSKGFVQAYNSDALWYPTGASSPADLSTFPYWVAESGGYYTKYGGVEDMNAFGVLAYYKTFVQVYGGTKKFCSYKIDNGAWVDAQNAEMDDIVDAQIDKRPIVYTESLSNKMALLFINPFADNGSHTLQVKDPANPAIVYTGTVSGSAPHLTLIYK